MNKLIRLAGVAAVLASVAVPGASASERHAAAVPSVLTCAGHTVVKPTSYVLACADANAYFEAIHWKTWGSTSATASATFVQNDCAPTCVAGKFVKYPAQLTLAAPVHTTHGLLFSTIRYRYTVSASTTLPLRTLSEVSAPATRPKCSTDPEVAAAYVIPPPPFSVRSLVVQRTAMPASEPKGRGPEYKRLYRVVFSVVRGNAVLPAGHRFTQFAYVGRASTSAKWCFVKGGSGP